MSKLCDVEVVRCRIGNATHPTIRQLERSANSKVGRESSSGWFATDLFFAPHPAEPGILPDRADVTDYLPAHAVICVKLT